MGDSGDEARYDEPTVKKIIEEAALIQSRAPETLSRAELESLAAELGIAPETVAQAVDRVAAPPAAVVKWHLAKRIVLAASLSVSAYVVVVLILRMLVP